MKEEKCISKLMYTINKKIQNIENLLMKLYNNKAEWITSPFEKEFWL